MFVVICVHDIQRYLTKCVIKLPENIKQHFCVDQIISFICRKFWRIFKLNSFHAALLYWSRLRTLRTLWNETSPNVVILSVINRWAWIGWSLWKESSRYPDTYGRATERGHYLKCPSTCSSIKHKLSSCWLRDKENRRNTLNCVWSV